MSLCECDINVPPAKQTRWDVTRRRLCLFWNLFFYFHTLRKYRYFSTLWESFEAALHNFNKHTVFTSKSNWSYKWVRKSGDFYHLWMFLIRVWWKWVTTGSSSAVNMQVLDLMAISTAYISTIWQFIQLCAKVCISHGFWVECVTKR